MSTTLTEPSRSTPVFGAYEVVVVGGGPAGIAAAAAAGRQGRKTLLIERYGFLGGMGTAAGVTNFCGLHANVHGEHKRVVHGVADELLERIDKLDGLNPPHLSFRNMIQAQAYDISAYKIAADELLASHGVNILFHALGVGAVAANGRIEAILVETKEGRCAVRGECFIDCSGDGDLSAWAGAPFEKGDGQGNMLYPSMMFRISGVDPERAGRAWETIPKLMAEAVAKGTHTFPRKGAIVRPQKNPIEWRANMTQLKNADGLALDATDARQLSRGEIEGRRQAWDVFQFVRQAVPGFEHAYIVEIGPQLGVRETRRVLGDYQLSEADVLACASFADTIGVNGWPIEAHVAGDVMLKFPPIPESRGFNQLPYRMIVPGKTENLFVAGRCASMTHEGQSAARVSGACFVMGEAAGTAAHLSLQAGVAPRQLDVGSLQRELEKQGVYLGRSW
ncbi:MAG TPA: FAD-dependent oxidoreductase [Rhodocyclaceae bacterium]|nr:FAD-dependent oxidoreductase [Rhodocyclaceae bacterium]